MLDLKPLAGDRYRITLDPSAEGEPRSQRPWYYRIPCRYGFISVWGCDTLAAYTDRRMVIARLINLDGVRVVQRGDQEVRVLLSPDRLDAIAEPLQARRRRRLSDTQRAAVKDRLARFQFSRT
jgi:hypothetical protein